MENRLDQFASLTDIEAYDWDQGKLAEDDQQLRRIEADAALARGRLTHAHFLLDRQPNPVGLAALERASTLYRELGDLRGEAEALFWLGTFHQVVEQDNGAALPVFLRARELATRAGDLLVLSCVTRHLGYVDILQRRPAAATPHLEESVRLRRDIGFGAGVAAALVALAELNLELGEVERAREQLSEAAELARIHQADGVAALVERVSQSLPDR